MDRSRLEVGVEEIEVDVLESKDRDVGPPARLIGRSEQVAAVLAGVLIDEERADGAAAAIEALRVAGADDTWPALHQAAGMVSVHCRCTIEQARDLIAARAFADGSPLREIAVAIVQGNLRLC